MTKTTPHQPSLFSQPQDETKSTAGKASVSTLREYSQLLRASELICTVTGMKPEQVLELFRRTGGSVFELARLPEHALRNLPHVGPKRAKQIAALTEWALLLQERDSKEVKQLRSPTDLANLLMLEMSLLRQEELRVIALNTKNVILGIQTLYSGSLNSIVVRIAEVMEMPLNLKAMGIMLVHNHPSGDPTPSPEDVRITEMVSEAANLLDLDLLDHLIIGRNSYVSLKERGLGFK
jgi:DNA repair protein RadC